jgi:NodT family efflux transporter outer membrane factor (OMF) lipoprotein
VFFARPFRLNLLGTVSLSLGLATSLTGCMVGPDFHAPHAAVPGGFTSQAPDANPYVSGDAVDPQWWDSFNDSELTKLESQAVKQNLDLQIATQRLLEAEGEAQVQGAVLYPNLNGGGSYTREGPSAEGPFGLFSSAVSTLTNAGNTASGQSGTVGGGALVIPANAFDLYQYGLQTQYDLDLFGKNRRLVEEAIAQARSSEEARRAALLNVEAQVASNYIQLRGTQAVLTITQKNLDTANQLVNLTVERQQAGLTTQLDVANARSAAAAIAAQIPTLIAQRDAIIGQIGLLLGQTPEGLPQELVTTAPEPLTPPTVPLGLPSQLVQRRPDVREAVQDLHAATAGVGVAVAQFFPDFTISASASLQSLQLKDLNEWKALTYAIGPSVTVPIFEGGSLRGQLHLRKAQQREAAISFAKTVLVAFTQVNTALTTYEQEHATLQQLNIDVEQSHIALGLAEEQYTQGLSDYLTVLNAQQSLLNAQQNQAQSLERLGTDLVTLYQALGGGWEGMYPAAAG